MRRAIIDLGTNTFNLLIGTVGDGDVKIEFATKEPVLLGMGGINEGIIAEDALARAKDTLTRFKELCDNAGVSSIIGLGTSAMRAASNASALIQYAREQLGFEIRVITGDEEARLIYDGVSILHNFGDAGVIMDIGGGSTEYIHAGGSGVISSASFDIGVSRVYQMVGNPEIFTDEIQIQVRNFFERETQGHFNFQCNTLIGASGSFETFYEMMSGQPFPKQNSATVDLPIEELRRLIDWSLKSSLEERMQHEWIVPMRKRMLPIAAYAILWTMEKLGTEKVIISPYSLKEGAFLH